MIHVDQDVWDEGVILLHRSMDRSQLANFVTSGHDPSPDVNI